MSARYGIAARPTWIMLRSSSHRRRLKSASFTCGDRLRTPHSSQLADKERRHEETDRTSRHLRCFDPTGMTCRPRSAGRRMIRTPPPWNGIAGCSSRTRCRPRKGQIVTTIPPLVALLPAMHAGPRGGAIAQLHFECLIFLSRTRLTELRPVRPSRSRARCADTQSE